MKLCQKDYEDMRTAKVHDYLYSRKAELIIAIYGGKDSCRALGALAGVSASSISRFLRSEEWQAWRLRVEGDSLLDIALKHYPAERWGEVEGSNNETHQQVLEELAEKYPFITRSWHKQE